MPTNDQNERWCWRNKFIHNNRNEIAYDLFYLLCMFFFLFFLVRPTTENEYIKFHNDELWNFWAKWWTGPEITLREMNYNNDCMTRKELISMWCSYAWYSNSLSSHDSLHLKSNNNDNNNDDGMIECDLELFQCDWSNAPRYYHPSRHHYHHHHHHLLLFVMVILIYFKCANNKWLYQVCVNWLVVVFEAMGSQ